MCHIIVSFIVYLFGTVRYFACVYRFFCAVLVPTSVICFFVLARPTLSMNTPVAAVTPLVLEEFTRELAAYPLSKRR